MDNSEINSADLALTGGFLNGHSDSEGRLENLFYSILENLRNNWDSNNSADLLLTLFFYRRLLCADETEFSPYIKIEKEDRQILNGTFSYLTDQNRDFSDFPKTVSYIVFFFSGNKVGILDCVCSLFINIFIFKIINGKLPFKIS